MLPVIYTLAKPCIFFYCFWAHKYSGIPLKQLGQITRTDHLSEIEPINAAIFGMVYSVAISWMFMHEMFWTGLLSVSFGVHLAGFLLKFFDHELTLRTFWFAIHVIALLCIGVSLIIKVFFS